MATILALKRRIQVAQNVSKTTRAMQMIAASKLKRAQSAALASRPYVEKLSKISVNVTGRVDKDSLNDYMKVKNNLDNKLVIFISPDKGLCGSLVSNLVKEAIGIDSNKTSFIAFGKKAELNLIGLGSDLIASFSFGNTLPSFDMVYPIMQIIDENFLKGKVSEVKILSTKFTNVFSQSPLVTDLLPIRIKNEEKAENPVLFEPNLSEILPTLLRHFLEMTVYQNILESYASEQAARMIAMKNATDNANDIVENLKLEYNKSRQEKITNEILDIASATLAANYE